jgi:hypothetical protein
MVTRSPFFGLLLLISSLLAATPLIASSSNLAIAQGNRSFESEEGDFRLQIPQGWVVQDHDIVQDPNSNSETVAELCLENEALPALGGGYNCEAAAFTDMIVIDRWSDLQSMPEFQSEPSTNITTNDLVALWIKYLQNNSISQIKIENNTDINEFRKIVDMTYQGIEKAGTVTPFDDYTYGMKTYLMFVLSQDRNTGYTIINNRFMEDPRQQSPVLQEVFDSFELVE